MPAFLLKLLGSKIFKYALIALAASGVLWATIQYIEGRGRAEAAIASLEAENTTLSELLETERAARVRAEEAIAADGRRYAARLADLESALEELNHEDSCVLPNHERAALERLWRDRGTAD